VQIREILDFKQLLVVEAVIAENRVRSRSVHVRLWWKKYFWDRFSPVLQFSPVSTIPPLLHTHPSIYHPHCIMFFSQYFSFPLSVPFHHCSILVVVSALLLLEEQRANPVNLPNAVLFQLSGSFVLDSTFSCFVF